jgi:hypothetical protein
MMVQASGAGRYGWSGQRVVLNYDKGLIKVGSDFSCM